MGDITFTGFNHAILEQNEQTVVKNDTKWWVLY